jgi:hypothetical protein
MPHPSFIDFKTASTIATSIVHSKLDYCNSLYHNLQQTQINRLQLIQNALARTFSRTPKSHHISPVIKSLHWPKVKERIEYKVISLSLTYNTLQLSQPSYLCTLITLQPPRSTRSSSFVTLLRRRICSCLKLIGRSFSYIAPLLWNNLPPSMRQPGQPSPKSSSQTHSQPISTNPQPLTFSRSLFHSRLETLLFSRSHSYLAPIYLHKPDRKAHPPE